MEEVVVINQSFWNGRRTLITGHTGFKGCWLSLWLHQLGAKVVGLSLEPATNPNLFNITNLFELIDSRNGDIRDQKVVESIFQSFQPEIVFHLAAQSLVRRSYRDPIQTFESNVMGTANILEGMRTVSSVKAAVLITTDKVYSNSKRCHPFREIDQLGGFDPYSASKAASEIVIASYRDAFLEEKGVAVASARAGNVIGGGDWSEDRLVPDAVRAWTEGAVLAIRNPHSVRPWQHVLDPLHGYLCLAERLYADHTLSGAFNFGPEIHEATSVEVVTMRLQRIFKNLKVQWHENHSGPHEAKWLGLDSSKASNLLGVVPRWNLEEAIIKTGNWYKLLYQGKLARDLCIDDINSYNGHYHKDGSSDETL